MGLILSADKIFKLLGWPNENETAILVGAGLRVESSQISVLNEHGEPLVSWMMPPLAPGESFDLTGVVVIATATLSDR